MIRTCLLAGLMVPGLMVPGLLVAGQGAATAASVVTVGSTPIDHPPGGRDASRLNLLFPTGWWDHRHNGTMEGSGFTWTYDPVAFGEGFARTFEIENVARPRMTKVLTLTLAVRAVFMADPGTQYCRLDHCPGSRHWDFWPQVAYHIGPPYILAGASNLGFDAQRGAWVGQFQFRTRPQPAAEYVTFQASGFPASVGDIVSMKLDISCIPEPSAWAMLIIGFGAVGSAVRRQRPPTARPKQS